MKLYKTSYTQKQYLLYNEFRTYICQTLLIAYIWLVCHSCSVLHQVKGTVLSVYYYSGYEFLSHFFFSLISQRRNNYFTDFQMRIFRKSVSSLQKFDRWANLFFPFTSQKASYYRSTELHLYFSYIRTQLCRFMWQYDGE